MKIGYNSESKLFSVIDSKEKTKEFGYLGWIGGEPMFNVYFAGKRKSNGKWEAIKFVGISESKLGQTKEGFKKIYSELKFYTSVMDPRSVSVLEQKIEDFCDEQNGDLGPENYGYHR